jgi:hypothetical protein
MRISHLWRYSVCLVALVFFAGCSKTISIPLEGSSVTETPTAIDVAIPTNTTSTGWVMNALSPIQDIAWAPNDPSIAYACGIQSNPGQSDKSKSLPVTSQTTTIHPNQSLSSGNGGIVTFGMSTNYGKSFQLNPTAFAGTGCKLIVNPTNAKALILLANTCSNCVPGSGYNLYQSLDSGQNWIRLVLPVDGDANTGDGAFAPTIAWLPDMVVVTPYFGNGVNTVPHVLAASTNSGELSWIDSGFPGTYPHNTIKNLYASGDQLFAFYTDETDHPHFTESGDHGQTWHALTPTYNNQPITLVQTSLDGKFWVGQCTSGLVLSQDSGRTWKLLPTLTGKYVRLLVAMDGTVAAQTSNNVAILAPGSGNWRQIGPPNGSDAQIIAFSYSPERTLLAIWANNSLQYFNLAH